MIDRISTTAVDTIILKFLDMFSRDWNADRKWVVCEEKPLKVSSLNKS